MSTRTFTYKQLEEMGVECKYELKEEIYEGRWSRHSNVVFKADDGLHYVIEIEEGLTENQDYYGREVFPDLIGDTVSLPIVELYTEMAPVKKWRRV